MKIFWCFINKDAIALGIEASQFHSFSQNANTFTEIGKTYANNTNRKDQIEEKSEDKK